MALQLLALLAMVAFTNARVIPSEDIIYSAPSYAEPHAAKEVNDFDTRPQYKFGYDVQDSLSGDSKSQTESRDGNFVQGEYSLIDADGYKRTVQYTVDAAHGFNALVSREPVSLAVKAATAPVAVKRAAPANVVDIPVPYTARTAETAYNNDPVVKGAYAVTPIVKATPVAYP